MSLNCDSSDVSSDPEHDMWEELEWIEWIEEHKKKPKKKTEIKTWEERLKSFEKYVDKFEFVVSTREETFEKFAQVFVSYGR